jgi:DNA-binding transcriptional MerR regulator
MLTISEVAAKFNISNQQVHELVNYGYLSVARVNRSENKSITYLFSEDDVLQLDVPSVLAEIRDAPRQNLKQQAHLQKEFTKAKGVMNYFDNLLDTASAIPEGELLIICYYLLHLNHYAKTYEEHRDYLYKLKNQTLQKMFQLYPDYIKTQYLDGPDRVKVWLCEDCKENARNSGISYNSYVKKDLACLKCTVQLLEPKYYSLIEFFIQMANYRFIFHLPHQIAARWVKNIGEMKQGVRKIGKYDDRMYLYGRAVMPIEEKLFPMPVIIEKINTFLSEPN